MSGLDIEGVLREHNAMVSGDVDGWHVVCACGYNDLGTSPAAHVAAVLREQIDGALAEAVPLVAKRLLKAASPEGLWAHLTPLERERFENHARGLLAELAAHLSDTERAGDAE